MEDSFAKYLKLFWALFFSLVGFIILMILLLFGLRFFFGIFDKIPGFNAAFTIFIICVPAMLFISVFLIFWQRTKKHPSPGARIVSYILFTVALAAWIYVFVKDLILFFTKYHREMAYYKSYDLFFLTGSVVTVFLAGVIQALALPKKAHWLEKHSQNKELY